MSLFITPSKKKRKPITDAIEQPPTKVRCLRDEPTVTKANEVTHGEVDFGLVRKGESIAERRDSMLVTALMAINLYLTPRNVMYTVVYWLSQYVNYKKPERLWFNDHITKLMRYPVAFSINTTHGLPRLHARVARHTLLLRFAGHELHKVPAEYFDAKGNTDLLECLDYYVNRVVSHFLVRNTLGLKGEVELDSFLYNRTLAYFYEPSFLILTSYLVYLHYLFHATGGRTLNDFLPSIATIAAPLADACLDESLVLSLDKETSNYATKRETFLADMRAIREILALGDVKRIEDEIELLWSRKASDVTELAHTRYTEIYTQLYSREKKINT